MIQPGYLRIGEAARYLSIDRCTLRAWCHTYRIPYYPVNKRVTLVKKADLDAMMGKFLISGPKDAARLADGRRK